MCGIAGIMTSTGALPPTDVMQAMEKALKHRGPDGQGHFAKTDIAMIQTRLAIIDLKTGDQPLIANDGVVLVANGEIYNYVELREALPGEVFKTQSDCEVALHLYRRFGLDFVRYLRGMYAIAIYDPASSRLILARDPFGIKPLYYAEAASGIAFASEPHALIKSGFTGAEINPRARGELFQLQFTTGSETIFKGIQRVLPGELLVIEKGTIIERRQIDALPQSGLFVSDAKEARTELDRVLAGSVGVHQRSDVPYGMFLSGGIDSSAILAMMARLNARSVKAFTAGFSGTAATDERELARAVAKSLGAEHTEVDFSEQDFWSLLPAVARAMDDPAADYAILPTFKLAAAARKEGLKVILSGEGGDELFAGYGRYRKAMRPWWMGGKSLRLRGTFDGLGVLRVELPDWRAGMIEAEFAANREGRTKLQIAQAVDYADWLPNDLLTKLDRCLMAHGVEGRVPFLDGQVAAFAFRLPDRLKVKKDLGKYLLREWLAEQAPAARPFSKKRGFTVPVGEWIVRHGARLGALVSAQESVRSVCKPDAVEDLFRAAQKKRAGFAAWTLLFYALWHKHHIEGRVLPPDVFAALGN
jgi:asparagine synthase (glutamine-hydrolysing)